jgi:hypothetical protein
VLCLPQQQQRLLLHGHRVLTHLKPDHTCPACQLVLHLLLPGCCCCRHSPACLHLKLLLALVSCQQQQQQQPWKLQALLLASLQGQLSAHC